MTPEEIRSELTRNGTRPTVINAVRAICHNEKALQSLCDDYASDLGIAQTTAIRLGNENAALRAELETAVSHLRAILAENDGMGDVGEALVQADRWLRSREV